MLLMPYLRRVVRPSLPLGTALLVVINVLVFFGFQQRDEGRYQLAFDYYHKSILARVEPPAYREYLKQARRDKDLAKVEKLSRHEETLPYLVHKMEEDDTFMGELRAGRIIKPEQEDYAQWQQARRYFDGVMASVTSEHYAFKTDKPSLLTAFTHQFLHGSTGHLVGNMVVLILIAPAVEALIGTPLFLAIYLIGGLGAAGMHWLVVGSSGGLVGASGAISAAMGAFAVLLRWKRIPFFYFIVVYFDIIKAPALLALPIWLANEAAQLFWFGDRHVAYGAHIGGLVVGGLLAWPLIKRAESRLLPEGPQVAEDEAESGQRQLQHHLAQARRLMRDNAYEAARRAYAQAAMHAGSDAAVWKECLNVLKLAPASEEFHKVSRAVMRKVEGNPTTQALILDAFRDYVRLAQPRPALDSELLVRLAERFHRHGCAAELERTARLLHTVEPNHPRCREILLSAASALYGAGDQFKAAELTKLAGAVST